MRKLFKVILDCDDVLFDSSQKAVDDLNRVYGTSFKINDIKQWGLLGSILDERLKYFSNPEFIENLPLYPGAQDFVHELSKKAEVVIATNVPPVCAGARVNTIIRHFPEITPSNILIGARKDLLVADMMLDDTSQNLEQANVDYPVLYRQPWNYGKTGLFSVSSYTEFLTLVDMVKSDKGMDLDSVYDAIVLVGPSGSGKNRYADRLIEEYPKIERVASYTTKGSSLADHYHHIDEEAFEEMRNDFFETSSYMGHLYGTREEDIQKIIGMGKIPLLVMDINGMVAMKAKYRTLAIYVTAGRESCIREILKRQLPFEETVQRISALDLEMRNEQFCDITVTAEGQITL